MQQSTRKRVEACRRAGLRCSHGTRARYMTGCKCLQCRAANSRYNSARELARKNGDTRDLTDAAPACAHIHRLGAAGVGYKQVAEASGVSKTVVMEIRSGRKTRIRAHTERAILAVDTDALADRALVPAAPMWEKLNELLERGFSKRQLALWLGLQSTLQFPKTLVTARTAMRVEKMVRLLAAGKLRRGPARPGAAG